MLFAKIFVAFFWADGAQLVQQHNSSLVKHRAKMQMLQIFTKVRSDARQQQRCTTFPLRAHSCRPLTHCALAAAV